MANFELGDRVSVTNDDDRYYGHTGTIKDIHPKPSTWDYTVNIDGDNNVNNWPCNEWELELAMDDNEADFVDDEFEDDDSEDGISLPFVDDANIPPLSAVDFPMDSGEKALERQVGGGHYKDSAIQPIEYIHANGLNFIEGSVVKYITRWRNKNGLEDLQKIKHYVDLLIELEELDSES